MKKATANNKISVNKLPEYTREELLGNIDKAFTLGDSEVISQRIFEFILKLVMNKVRLKQVDSLMNDYIIDKTFKMLNRIVVCEMNMLKYDQDKEFTQGKSNELDKFVFNISKPKVDTWASNKTNIIVIKQPDTPTELNKSNLSTISNGGSTYNKTLVGLSKLVNTSVNRNKEKEILIENKSRVGTGFNSVASKNFGDPMIDSLNSFNQTRKAIKDEYPLKKFAAMNFMNSNNKKVEVDELEQYHLEISQNQNEEPQDEMDLLKEKALRAYFREKELERERKRNLDTEAEEKSKEDERRRKKLLEEMTKRPFSFDFEGKVLNVRPPDIQKMTKQAPFPTGVIKEKILTHDGTGKHSIINENNKNQANSQNHKNILIKSNANDKSGISQSQQINKNKIAQTKVEFQNSEDEMEILETLQERYYQPDPITSHQVPPGVTMEFYGVKKTGGKFETNGKLSNEDFQTLLTKYKPKIKFYTKPKNLHHLMNNLPNVDRKKYIEEHQPGNQEPFRLTQIFEIKNSERDNYYDIDDMSFNYNQGVNKEKIIKIFNKPGENVKTTIDWKKKNDIAKVSALKDFNLENYLPEDVENMYEMFKYYNENTKDIITQTNFRKKLPENLHQNKSKDKNLTKKNPRDRISKEILAGKNKTVTIVAKEKVETKSELQNQQNIKKISLKKSSVS